MPYRIVGCFTIVSAICLANVSLRADPPAANSPSDGLSATFSIVAVDPDTGVCGAAVASKYPAVGKVVPYVRAGVGAFCTQHWHHPQFGKAALDLLEAGNPPEDVLSQLLRNDPQREQRQLAIVDLQGRAANRNPSAAGPPSRYWGAQTGRFYACQGNTLAGRNVITDMARAYEETAGSISDRLMAALVAGDRAGGDHRGKLAAGIRVAKPGVAGNWFELDVDDSDDAVEELLANYIALKHDAKGEAQFGAKAVGKPSSSKDAVPLIFDTDMGNDIDDALALGVIHALQTRGECKLLAVTLSKDNEFAAPYVDLVNTFYGRGEIPVGVVRDGKTPEDSKYIRLPSEAHDEGRARYPHDLASGKVAPEAVALLRKVLAAGPDGQAVLVVVGFSTNLARLLDSPADDVSPLAGRDLVKKKVRLLSMMAGMFGDQPRMKEYNVFIDIDAAKKVFADWPTPIVTSGFEIGQAIRFPAQSIERDFSYVRHHPLREGYELYQKMPYDRETWDLTAVLYAVRPDRNYFGLSPTGTIAVDDQQVTQFAPAEAGRHRYLTVTPEQIARVREALVQLASQPPER
ncbi:MAG: DUF1028 domain-containing protein [Planctomycetaceae bacterium]|nr:DUF1028 domain-containing protein [Planctomycetaceae bacterium]